MKQLGILALMALSLAATASAAPGGSLLTPVAERITDEAIAADLSVMDRLHARLAALNARGIPMGSYHFAKAQAWIDFARDNYLRNDRTPAMEEALRQAERIITLLEQGAEITRETPIIPSSMPVRPDLWRKAATMKNDPGFPCAADEIARLEVQLVWAGHEELELGWRHSRPYLLAAERLAGEAENRLAACRQPEPAPAAVPSVEATTPTAAAGQESHAAPVVAAQPEPGQGQPLLKDRVHFAFDSTDISPASAAVLKPIAAAMVADPGLRLMLQGHADRQGDFSYNLSLSRKRAQQVKEFLVRNGVAPERVTIVALGEAAPCADDSRSGNARNRRVEFTLTSGEVPGMVPQTDDLQSGAHHR